MIRILSIFVFQDKQAKGKFEPSAGVPLKTLAPKRSQQPFGSGQETVQDTTSKSTLESSEAVTQLLNATAAGEQMQETEWEEVIISEAHLLANNTQTEEQGNTTAVIQFQEGTAHADSSLERKKAKENDGQERQTAVEAMSPANVLSNPTSTMKHPMG